MKYLDYTIKALQPVIINEISSKAKTQKTLDYIMGGSVRGAFAYAFLRDNPESALKRVLDEVVFSNAYIACGGRPCIPMPKSFQADKHSIRSGNPTPAINILRHDPFSDEGKQYEAIDRKYTYFEPESQGYAKVAKTQDRRVALNTDSADGGALFYTEAIKAGQSFCGSIRFPDDMEGVVQKTVEAMGMPSFGAYQNSGFGGCELDAAGVSGEARLCPEIGKAAESELYIYCLSDVISYGEEGVCLPDIDAGLLDAKLGIKDAVCQERVLAQRTASGYNNRFRATYPRETAIAAGSVFKYSYSGTLDADKALSLQRDGVGKRRTEGFGRIFVNPGFLLMEHIDFGGVRQ